jgi:hypothetical protein
MSNRTIVELNHDYSPRNNVRDLLVWALQMRAYMGSADPDTLPNGVAFLHFRHHSEPCPLPRQPRDGHGRIRPDIAAKIVDDMLAAMYAPEQEGVDAALGEPKASEHISPERRRGLEEAARISEGDDMSEYITKCRNCPATGGRPFNCIGDCDLYEEPKESGDAARDGARGSAATGANPNYASADVERMREALIQARGALRLDCMVDNDGKPFGTTTVALDAIDAALLSLSRGREGVEDISGPAVAAPIASTAEASAADDGSRGKHPMPEWAKARLAQARQGWRPITAADVGKTMLVTNNIKARNAHGEMSHRWITWIQKADKPKETGKYVGFDCADRLIHDLTHCAPIPVPEPETVSDERAGAVAAQRRVANTPCKG